MLAPEPLVNGFSTPQPLTKAQELAIPDQEPPRPENGFKYNVSKPYIDPIAKEKVLKVIDRGEISSATQPVREFEEALCRFYTVSWAKACSSGYTALVLALKNGKIGKDDEVLIPSLTMIAVATAVRTVGARPVFVDCEKDELNPSVDKYREAFARARRPKALIVTHTYGVPADCEALRAFCDEKGIIFIEDIAESIGSKYKDRWVGTFGHFAAASLYANKLITAGDGGFLLSTIGGGEEKARSDCHANHGFTKGLHFVHWEFSGNYKMSALNAAFVTPSVAAIPTLVADREQTAQEYRLHLDGLEGLWTMPINQYGPDTPWVFGVTVETKAIRTFVRRKMAEDGIETRDYFFPLHLQPCVTNEYGPQDCMPNAEWLGSTGFYLPTYYGLTKKDVIFISSSLKTALEEARESKHLV